MCHFSKLLVVWLLWTAAANCAAQQGLPPNPVVSIAFVGDVMLADGPGQTIRRGKDPLAFVAHMLRKSDIRIANLECVIATKGFPEPDKPFTFRAHPRTLKVVRRHFDAVSLANNHSGDFGPEAFGQMLGLLNTYGVGYFGGGRNLALAHEPLIIERKGLRIAFLGYNEFFPRNFEADTDRAGVAWSEDEQVTLDIRNARALHHADIVIPMMHWGWEHDLRASQRQQQLARLMIDAGADAVVGGHPHVIQNTEQYRGKPIIYSLGNFVFDGFDDAPTTTGWLLQMDVAREGVLGWQASAVRIDSKGTPRPQHRAPVKCWKSGWADSNDCR
jgi:poly-gamma-glutamate capsule biosynthesis protein CapA/YwtB (metallophosphatase superfamily)